MAKDYKKEWTDKISKELVGKTIESVEYMSDKEMEMMGWYSAPIVITFTDGTILTPSADDEGNNGGALFTNIEGLPTIPVMR